MAERPIRVLVTDALHPIAAEAVCQTLAVADGAFEFHAVEDGAPDVPGPGIVRYWDCPASGQPGFERRFAQIVSELRPALIVPWSDRDARAVSSFADDLTRLGAALVLPSPHIVEVCDDKIATQAVLRDAGLHCVESLSVTATDDLPAAARQLGYPARTLRVKPRNEAGSRGQWRISSRLDAAALDGATPTIPLEALVAIHAASAEHTPLILQPEIVGAEINTDFLAHAGALLLFSMRRSMARLGGTSVAGAVLDRHPVAEEAVQRAVAAFEWSNLGNVQLFVTPDGRPLFFELNARASGGLGVSALAGVDILHAALRYTLWGPDAVGAGRSRPLNYRKVWKTELS